MKVGTEAAVSEYVDALTEEVLEILLQRNDVEQRATGFDTDEEVVVEVDA